MIGGEATWYWQVGFVVAGHVAALMLAHDRALALYDDAKLGRALAVLDARGDGRLHEPRALAALFLVVEGRAPGPRARGLRGRGGRGGRKGEGGEAVPGVVEVGDPAGQQGVRRPL